MDKEDRNALVTLAVLLTMLIALGGGILWLDAKLTALGTAIENNGKALAELRMDFKDIRTDLQGLRMDIRALRMDIRALRTDIRGLRTDVAVMLSEVG